MRIQISDLKSYELLFGYKQIETSFSDIIYAWFEKAKDIAPIRGHLIDSIKSKTYYTSLDFLILVQALEGFHRRFIDKSKNKKIVLKKRLSELMDQFSDIDKIKKSSIDIEATVQSRDYYSHFFDRREKPLLLDGIPLLHLSQKLRMLLICCVLHLIGFSHEKIDTLLNNCDKM